MRPTSATSKDGNNVAVLRQSERRQRVRKGALWVGELTTPTGTHACRVLNLSPQGAKIEVKALIAVHQPVTLNLEPLGAFVGSVRWQRDRCIGIAINEHRFTTTRSRTLLAGGLRLP